MYCRNPTSCLLKVISQYFCSMECYRSRSKSQERSSLSRKIDTKNRGDVRDYNKDIGYNAIADFYSSESSKIWKNGEYLAGKTNISICQPGFASG